MVYQTEVMKMKIRQVKWALLASVFCSSLASAASSGVLIKNETLYAKPVARSASAGRLVRGTPVTIVSRKGGWVQVASGKSRGWVRMFSVRSSGARSAGAASELAGWAQAGQRRPGNVVATAGVRGLNEEDLKTAEFSQQGVSDVESYAVSASAARQFASQARLASRRVAYLPDPVNSRSNNTESRWEETQ